MDENEELTPAVLSRLAAYQRPLILGGAVYMAAFMINPFLPFFCAGPVAIWWFVRSLNRRHDPRYRRLPADEAGGGRL